MRPQPILRSLLHLLHNILTLSKINKSITTQLLRTHPPLLIPTINSDRPQPHSLGVLLGQTTQTAAGAYDGDGLARPCAGFFETLVDGYAGAEDGGDGVEGDGFVDAGDVRGFGYAVLLEGTVDGVA